VDKRSRSVMRHLPWCARGTGWIVDGIETVRLGRRRGTAAENGCEDP